MAELIVTARLRRSSRALTGRLIAREMLEGVLRVSGAVVHRVETPGGSHYCFPYPTAGGLASTRLIILAWAVLGLDAGIYTYNPADGSLEATDTPLPTRHAFTDLLEGQDWALGASAAILIGSDRSPCVAKYGEPRAEELLLLEAGHCAQMVALALADARLAAVAISGFQRDDMRRLAVGLEPRVVLLCSPPVGRRPEVSHGVPARLVSPESLPLTIEAHRWGTGHVVIARQRVPATGHWATGAVFANDEGAGRNAASAAARGEARELWTGLSAVPETLVHARAEDVEGVVVHPSQVLLDARQRDAVRQCAVDARLGHGRRTHWILARDVFADEECWVPASAVLLGHRFFDWTLLATSSGSGCGRTVGEARRHALDELLERKVFPFASGGRHLDPAALVAPLRRAFEERGASLIVSLRQMASRYFCEAQVGDAIIGSAVRATPEGAVAHAASECCAKLLAGTVPEPAIVDQPTFTLSPDESVESVFTRNGIRVAECALNPAEDIRSLFPGAPVVRLIGWHA